LSYGRLYISDLRDGRLSATTGLPKLIEPAPFTRTAENAPQATIGAVYATQAPPRQRKGSRPPDLLTRRRACEGEAVSPSRDLTHPVTGPAPPV
jgi:hypothetical protein